jgi:purine nucleoside permease
MSVLGIASQVAGLVNPYFEQEENYRAEEKRLEAESIKTQMQINNELQKAEDQEWGARQAELAAETAKNEGKVTEAAAAEAAYRAKARGRAGLAQSGILGSATGEAVMAQAESEAAADQLKIQQASGQKVQGLLNQANDYRRQAGYYRQSAAQTGKAAQLRVESTQKSSSNFGNILGGLQTVGSILGGVSQVYRLFR